MTARVLVVDDDATVRDVVGRYLDEAGYQVDLAADGPTGLRAARERRPDAVVLDLMLPGMTGLDVCRALRREDDRLPIVMLTALGEEDDRVLGLRIGSVLRRSRPAEPAGSLLVDGSLRVDPAARRAELDGGELALTLREFDLLAYLLAHPGRAYTRAELLAEVWGWEFGDQSTVTVHVRRLREKIEADPTRPQRIATIWG